MAARPRKQETTIAGAAPTAVREDILQAAKVLFRQKGYSAVSVNEIVAQVNITKPTLYYYFGDKEQLYTEVLIDMMRHGHEFIIQNTKRNQPIRKILLTLAEGYFEFSPTSLATLMRDAREHLDEKNFRRVLEANQYFMMSPFQELFDEAMARGELKPVDVQDLARVFVSLLDVFTVKTSHQEGRAFDYKANAKIMVTLFLDGAGTQEDR